MRSRFLTIWVIVSFFTLAMWPFTAQAQAASRDWSAVQLLLPNDNLVIDLKQGGSKKGKLTRVSDSGIAITNNGNVTDVGRNDVRRVYRLSGRSRGKSAAIGAVVGGGAGTGVGIGLFAQGDFVWGIVPIVGLMGAGIGAGVGALFGRQKRVLIYEA